MNEEDDRIHLTEPDYIVYVPSKHDRTGFDSHSEHFLVFDGPDGSLMTVWTQSHPAQNSLVNHTMFSRSTDEGETWQEPKVIAGPKNMDDPANMTNWAFPMVSKSGRIYVLWNQGQGVSGWISFHTGTMAGIYSDDNGETWSESQDVPQKKSAFDDPEGKIPGEWIVWQLPQRDLSGNYFVGYSHWVNKAVAALKDTQCWTEIESVVEFMRFMNIDDDPEPRDIEIRYSAWGDKALRVPHRRHPLVSVTQEPSIVRLPDDRLFCVMRTCSGYMWWSESKDDGETWSMPRPLLHHDAGRPLLNPVASDPIYKLSDGRYILFYHNNPGGVDHGGFNDATPRDPLYAALGEYRPDAEQPVWFSQPKLFMATEGTGIDGVKRPLSDQNAGSLSLYSSFTSRNGNDVLWYPESKFWLLGKRVTQEFLAGMNVPG